MTEKRYHFGGARSDERCKTVVTPPATAAAEHEGPTDFDEPDTGAVRHLRKAFGHGPANGESYVASAEDIARCLTANPQLRAAVLAAVLRGLCDSDFDEYLRVLPVLAPDQPERALANAHEKLRAAESELATERARVAELTDAINIDRTGLAAGLNHVVAVVKGYQWIADGHWGSYEHTERTVETLQREVGHLIKGACDGARRALKASGDRATKALRSPQQPAPPHDDGLHGGEKGDEYICPDCDFAGDLPHFCPVKSTDGGGASPGEAKCKYCNRVGCESEKYRDDSRLLRMCRHAVQLERDFLQNRVGRVERALERLQEAAKAGKP